MSASAGGAQHGELPDNDFPTQDGASYVDAATVALRYSSVAIPSDEVSAEIHAEPVTPRSFRDAMGCLATGVCVITTVADGADVAMTANSVTSVSLDPPLVLVCVAKTARFHEAIIRAGLWGISILDAQAHDISSALARPGQDKATQLARLVHDRGRETGVALIDSSVAHVECVTYAVHDGGDHDIVVGEVKAIARTGAGGHPLLFHRGSYRWLL